MAYITDRLDARLDVETLARVANLSPFHFHRIYRATLDETVADTVRRLRLRRAASDLLERRLTISRVARRAGYASTAAFNRAFRVEYADPPARYKTSQREWHGATDAHAHDVELIRTGAVRVAVFAHRGDYSKASGTFERLMTLAATNGLLRPETRTFGIYYDDPQSVPVEQLRADVCVSIPIGARLPEGFSAGKIGGGTYAKVTHQGAYGELWRVYDWLYKVWLPFSGKQLRDRPCVEEYLNSPRRTRAAHTQTAVMMPLSNRLGSGPLRERRLLPVRNHRL